MGRSYRRRSEDQVIAGAQGGRLLALPSIARLPRRRIANGVIAQPRLKDAPRFAYHRRPWPSKKNPGHLRRVAAGLGRFCALALPLFALLAQFALFRLFLSPKFAEKWAKHAVLSPESLQLGA